MREDDEASYHVRRVREEMDLGYCAESSAAASAHLQLAALHMRLASKTSGSTSRESAIEECDRNPRVPLSLVQVSLEAP
jgi:hypothetical protein